MPIVERSVAIDAPAEKVFGYMDQPPNRAEISPSMAEAKDVGRLPNGGSRPDRVYEIAGIPFEGGVGAVEYVPDRSIVSDLSGGIRGRIRRTFAPRDGGTVFTYSADYTVPGRGPGQARRRVQREGGRGRSRKPEGAPSREG